MQRLRVSVLYLMLKSVKYSLLYLVKSGLREMCSSVLASEFQRGVEWEETKQYKPV